MTSARQLRPAEGRARILDAALAVFAERGYHATSISEIGERAGIAKSVMYHHFGSKAGLYEAILEAQTRDLVGVVTAALPDDPKAPRLRAGLDAYLAFLQRRPLVWELLFRDPPLDEEVRAAYDHHQRKRTKALADLISAPRTRDARQRAQKKLYTELLVTAVRGYTAWWREHPRVAREHVLDAIMAFAEAGAKKLGARR